MAAPCQVRPQGRRRAGGFTLLELVIVIVLVGTLLAIAANRLLPFIDEAERVAVLKVEGQLRSSLQLEAAERIAGGRSATLSGLDGTNPVKFLLDPPKNYLGELNRDAAVLAPPRHWFYLPERGELVYRPGPPFGLEAGSELTGDAAFRVQVAFDDVDGNGIFDAARDELYGVRLLRSGGVEWLAGNAGRRLNRDFEYRPQGRMD